MNWYIYFDKETLMPFRVSPVLEEDDKYHMIAVSQELGLEFIDSPHKFRDYLVYFDGTKIHFIKKEHATKLSFYYSPVLIDDKIQNPDIRLTVKKNKLEISIRKEIINYAIGLYKDLEKNNQAVQFYVSARNDPNKLIEIIKVDMSKLISAGKVKIPFKHDLNDVSIFTRKVFDSYGLQT